MTPYLHEGARTPEQDRARQSILDKRDAATTIVNRMRNEGMINEAVVRMAASVIKATFPLPPTYEPNVRTDERGIDWKYVDHELWSRCCGWDWGPTPNPRVDDRSRLAIGTVLLTPTIEVESDE